MSIYKARVLCRAFTTSQSAAAHLSLFRQIFAIAAADTGIQPQIRHIHGDGIGLVIADEHKGEAKGQFNLGSLLLQYINIKLCAGWGECMQELAQAISPDIMDEFEPNIAIRDLTPYQHLARMYRLCGTHHNRGVEAVMKHVPPDRRYEVKEAMKRLSSLEPIEDFEKLKKTIRSGGEKAKSMCLLTLIGSLPLTS